MQQRIFWYNFGNDLRVFFVRYHTFKKATHVTAKYPTKRESERTKKRKKAIRVTVGQ